MRKCLATVSFLGLMIAVLLGGFGFVNVSFAQQEQFVPVGPPVMMTTVQPAVPNATGAESAIESVDHTLDALRDHTLDALKDPSAVGREILRRGIDGINSLGSNCGCLPPDTNAAVSEDF